MRLLLPIFLFYSLSCVLASHAASDSVLPESLRNLQPALQKIGEARYKKFGFKLYDAEFWSTASAGEPLAADQGYALSLQYLRDISKTRLVEATNTEWQRLAPASETQIADWIAIIDNMWPDVSKGTILTCAVFPNGRTVFYLGNEQIGEILDAEFGLAFLNIWLNDASQFSKQRQRLLGL